MTPCHDRCFLGTETAEEVRMVKGNGLSSTSEPRVVWQGDEVESRPSRRNGARMRKPGWHGLLRGPKMQSLVQA